MNNTSIHFNYYIIIIHFNSCYILPKRIAFPWFRVHTVVINDPGRLISIHLVHSSIILGWAGSITLFGYSHLAGNFGPGCWTSDESAITGTVQSISPSYSILALNPFSYGTVVAHHTIAGAVGLGIGLWHTSNRPDNFIFTLVKMFSIESVLSSSIAKGGLFRSGPLIKGDGIIENWTGHPEFSIENINLSVRRIPSFFETFPVLLIDKGGSLRADIAFRRASSRYSIEQRQVRCLVFGGIYGGSELNQAPELCEKGSIWIYLYV